MEGKKHYVFTCPDCGNILMKSKVLEDILGLELKCEGPHGYPILCLSSREDIHIEYGEIKKEDKNG